MDPQTGSRSEGEFSPSHLQTRGANSLHVTERVDVSVREKMLRRLKRVSRLILEEASTYYPRHREALEICRLERAAPNRIITPNRQHLTEAISWIKRAQEAAGDGGGVSWGYRARAPVRSAARLGWIEPYPETTGYIIPTLLRYARFAGDSDSAEAARRMAAWELQIQLPDGGFQGGLYGSHPVSSSTFVTGQVLFGLLEAYREWRTEHHYRDAAIRAGDFLLRCLDESGRFTRGYSHFCAPGSKAYEVRTGLAMAELGVMLEQDTYTKAASRIADYAISCQQQNGWFRENDLDWHDRPLTHTIGYVLEGLHGLGLLLNRPDCQEAVQRTLSEISKLIRSDGFLAGRWRSDWSPAVDWVCLTGSAQIAGVFLRMHRRFGIPEYFNAAHRLLGFVCSTQEIKGQSPALSGGIRGSYPFGGEYGQWCVLNWATKFFADSLMDYLEMLPTAAKQ
jgi:hypothetical protein